MMKKGLFLRIITMLLCVAITTALFSSCNKNSLTSVKIPLDAVPNCFDPQIASGESEESILNNCFEGLVRINELGEIIDGVASSWAVSEDGLTYTFNLRSDAKWHLPSDLEDILGDNYEKSFDTRVTAHDFVFGITRAMDPSTGSPMASTLSCIRSISAESDSKLVIVLKNPNVNFLTTMASPAAMPCNETFFEATAGRYGLKADLTLCNGPYYIGSIDKESGVIIYKNNDYKGSCEALFSSGRFLITKSFIDTDNKKDEETTLPSVYSLLALKDGGYDIATVTKSESESLGDDYTVERYKNTIKAFCFNTHNNALANDNVRLALAYATNPEIFAKDGSRAEGIIPSCCGRVNIVRPIEYNSETASSFFNEAVNNNYDESGDLQDLSLEFSLICLKEDETNVKRVLQDWQKVFGVSLSITVTPCDTQAEVNKAVNSGNYDIAYTAITATESTTTDFLARFTTDSGTNIVGYKNSSYDEILSSAMNASTNDELMSKTEKAETLLLQSGCFLPTVSSDGYLAKDSTAEKITVRPSGSIYALYTIK